MVFFSMLSEHCLYLDKIETMYSVRCLHNKSRTTIYQTFQNGHERLKIQVFDVKVLMMSPINKLLREQQQAILILFINTFVYENASKIHYACFV